MVQIKKAYEMAKYYHRNQKDRAGMPYIKHLEYVASKFEDTDKKILAYLHDSLEDTEIAPEKIEEEFGATILEALLAITKKPDDEYMAYIHRVGNNGLARCIKIEDLKHNMDLSRIPDIQEEDRLRAEKYKKALAILEDRDENK